MKIMSHQAKIENHATYFLRRTWKENNFPGNPTFEHDNDGQIVIYTGIKKEKDLTGGGKVFRQSCQIAALWEKSGIPGRPVFEYDNEGQIVIYTGMFENQGHLIVDKDVDCLISLIHKNTKTNDLHEIGEDRCRQAINAFLVDFLKRKLPENPNL